jgi:hypothetical protein
MAQRSKLLLLGLNHTYQQIAPAAIAQRLQSFGQLDLNQPYLLNVGSSLPRKNREGILKTYQQVSTEITPTANGVCRSTTHPCSSHSGKGIRHQRSDCANYSTR